ncbi:hypothetical protein Tsubulata_028613 [Turnera subulata]|uniref:B-like cyclin n=1 Tax=Turnera subulata TaxID=218843 RepID=A0A9Q0FKZ3_9ROSI|nr:hypothetical protein Tsubulata_028613 [Turnera subulata]
MARHHEEEYLGSPSFVCDALYCSEENWEEEVMREEEYCSQEGQGESSYSYDNKQKYSFPILLEQELSWDDEELTSLLNREEENQLYNNLEAKPSLAGARREAVEWILKVNSHYSFTALTAVLAANYLDRFLGSVQFQQDKPWMTQLAAVACLSLAAKVEETQAFLLLDLQANSRSMRYLPSVMATATMLHVINGIEPCLGAEYQSQLLGILRTDKDKVEDCCKLIVELASRDNSCNYRKRKFGSSPGSPNGVMDVSFSSDSSNDSWAVASSVSSSPEALPKKSRTMQSLNHTKSDFLSIPR